METAAMLNQFGLSMHLGGVVLADMEKAESAYVHHSSMPVALTGFALVSPAFARGRFPQTRLASLVAKVPSMDYCERESLAAVCGADVRAANLPLFVDHLHDLIQRRPLHLFFRCGARPVQGIDVLPLAFDQRSGQVDDAAMRTWRRHYKDQPPEMQMLVASVLWLYRGGVDKTWLCRVPCAWHAADAVDTLKRAGMLGDWARLLALYPGW